LSSYYLIGGETTQLIFARTKTLKSIMVWRKFQPRKARRTPKGVLA
jgi:hypothetical protein